MIRTLCFCALHSVDMQQTTFSMKSPDSNDVDDGKSDDDVEEVSTQNEEVKLYSFGHRYYYWDHYRNDPMFIAKTKKDLKEELRELIPVDSWNLKWCKALELMKTNEFKRLKSTERKNYDIKRNKIIGVDHVLALIFYTDFGEICFEFSSTFRQIGNETLEDAMKRNTKYREWSRCLQEAVEIWGTTMV